MSSTIGIVLLQPSDLEQSFPSEERGLLMAHHVGICLILRQDIKLGVAGKTHEAEDRDGTWTAEIG